MPAGNVPRFMRQHADDLVRRRGFHDRADIHEDASPIRHEGVEGAIRHQNHTDETLAQTRSPQQRIEIFAHQLLDLRIADEAHPRAILLLGEGRRDALHQQRQGCHSHHQRPCEGAQQGKGSETAHCGSNVLNGLGLE